MPVRIKTSVVAGSVITPSVTVDDQRNARIAGF